MSGLTLAFGPYHYHLEVIQNPKTTAEFRNASLSRLPLTPPLVARLTVTDARGMDFVPEDELPFLITHLSLYPVTGERRIDANWQSEQGPPILYGNLVSAVDLLEDLQGNMGLFFLFPDVSIRWQGRFRLRVSLLKIGRRVV
ncbi:hypothetical protein BDZ89DRAFT_1089591 [Hymenopellis radicata]|nr:hypothetical protein BDZ89DRAFT_1089591 [Hymenopellis radicata]